MSPACLLALLFNPSLILRERGLEPDPWQRQLLLSDTRQMLLNCSRQSGKSTTVAALALHTALRRPGALVLLLSPSLRQSQELFRKVIECYAAIGRPIDTRAFNQTCLELETDSRVICLPGREETIRSFSGVNLLVIDEAARVPDDLYRSVRPMLAVSAGRLICLSTPFGKRGFFHEAWEHGGDRWRRIRIPWQDCPRIPPEFIDMEKHSMGESWVRQEYECSFEALEGLVYPDFEVQCATDSFPIHVGQSFEPDVRLESLTYFRQVGGIDFGFRNPFCALWGVLDRDDVLWITHERYLRETTIHEHAAALMAQARHVTWYADPAGATEIAEFRRAGLKILRGENALQAGIAAVHARLRTGRLRVLRSSCPNLLAEAKLYRYPKSEIASSQHQVADSKAEDGSSELSDLGFTGSETPIDQHNHALAALRYLISRLDSGFLARFRRRSDEKIDTGEASGMDALTPRRSLRLNDDELWKIHSTE
jgi:hypothetical protein